jgi:hypothetical protein
VFVHAQYCEDGTFVIQVEGVVQESFGQAFSLKIGGKQVCAFMNCKNGMVTLYK